MLSEMRKPEAAALLRAGQRKFDDHVEPAAECGIEAGTAVTGQNSDSLEGFDPLQKIIGLRIRETVIRFLDFRALAEERIGLVKQEDDFGVLGARQQLR